MSTILPTDKSTRKSTPMARGLVDYFPRALAAVANVSFVANEQHNPGEPMHWAKEKSSDHADCVVRHLVDRGGVDDDGLRHSAKLAWRALALLEMELEEPKPEPEPDYSNVPEASGHNTASVTIAPSGEIVSYRGEPIPAGNPSDSETAVDLDKCGTTDGVTPLPELRYNSTHGVKAIAMGRDLPVDRHHWIVRGANAWFVGAGHAERPSSYGWVVDAVRVGDLVLCNAEGEAL